MGHVEIVMQPDGRRVRLFARKRLHARYRVDPAFRAMFLEDARVAQSIRHDNVVRVFESGEDADGPFLIMELVDGIPVVDLVTWAEGDSRGLPQQVAIRIARTAALGLQAIHEQVGPTGAPLGLLHRNVSGQNILVGHDGTVRLTDVAIARALGGDAAAGTTLVRGNKGYLSPEQLRLQPLDVRADLFGLGVALWEMLAGERLYPNREGADGPRGILHEAIPAIAELRENANPALADLLASLVAQDRDQRPGTAAEIVSRLDEILTPLITKQGAIEIEPFMSRAFHAVHREQQAELNAQLEQLGVERSSTQTPKIRLDGGRGRVARAAVRRPPTKVELWLMRAAIAAVAVAAGFMVFMGAHSNATIPPPPARKVPDPGQTRTAWAGGWHSCGIEDKVLYCWGKNSQGQLGVGGTEDEWTRRPVASLVDPANVATGLLHTCACARDGQAYCWGRNNEGQLGLGMAGVGDRPTPTAVSGLTDCAQLAAGPSHTCARRFDGTAACWGLNDHEQVGRPASPAVLVPTTVTGLVDVAQIATGGAAGGGQFTCARSSNGAVLCWGDNGHGQLGDGTKVSRARPAPVKGIDDAVELALGGRFACARRRSGKVVCWGDNSTGALGDGTRSDHTTPVQIGGLNDIAQLAAGLGHACALSAKGELRCWGDNRSGQIGNGTREASLAPVRVVDVDRFIFVTAGLSHTCGRHATGLVCWGDGENGQLGTGSDNTRVRPASVPGFHY